MKKIMFEISIKFTDKTGKNVEVKTYASSNKELISKTKEIMKKEKGGFLSLFNF